MQSETAHPVREVAGEIGDMAGFLQNILESSTEYAIIGMDIDGNILLWNEGARRLYGYAAHEVVGRAGSAILYLPEDVQAGRHIEIAQAALRDGKWEGTLQHLRRDGQRFMARAVVTPRRDTNGKVIGFLLVSKDISGEPRLTEPLIGTGFPDDFTEPDGARGGATARDMTERRRFEKTLQDANRMQTEFLASMGHALRTPLNNIIGFSEFMLTEKPGPLPPRQKEYLRDVLNSARELSQRIDDALERSKVEARERTWPLE